GDLAAPAWQDRFWSFCQGCGNRTGTLGDTGATAEPVGKWRLGGPGTRPDLLLLVSADTPDLAASGVSAVRAALKGAATEIDAAHTEGARLYDEGKRSVEHFGFADGLSQPWLIGWLTRSNRP